MRCLLSLNILSKRFVHNLPRINILDMDSTQRLDLVIFGASGFTGRYAVKEVEKLSTEKKLTWGISGRNESKLKEVLTKVGKDAGKDLSETKIIIADVDDEKSLVGMAQQASVVVNCCGPYRHWGEAVVKACIIGGANYVDVSGEPEFMERMQLEYNEEAEKKGVYIISACGFDSIPADLGAVYLQQNFPGDINAIETYIKSWVKGSYEGASIHYGTWESAIYGVANMSALRPLRQKLNAAHMPKMLPKLKLRGTLFQSQISRGWCLPFPGADRSVMQRTQRFLYENEKKRPAQVGTYISFPSLITALAVAFVTVIFALMCRTQFGRQLLLKHPRFFSMGFISHEGPSEEKMKNTHFEVILVGQGWKHKAEDPAGIHETAPDQEITVKVSGTNPGYGATCTLLALAGITVLKESQKMPKSGGVLTPGAAFANTSLVKELHSHGVKFEVLPNVEQARL